ncbi:MAG: hypothetical protein WCR01_15150 [Bacteroidota bacterium]
MIRSLSNHALLRDHPVKTLLPRNPLSVRCIFPENFRYRIKHPQSPPPDLKTGKCPALCFDEPDKIPLLHPFPGILAIPPPKSFKKRKHIGSGYLITCRTTQSDNFSAIAR